MFVLNYVPHLQLFKDMRQRKGAMLHTGCLVCGDQVLTAHILRWEKIQITEDGVSMFLWNLGIHLQLHK
jgi:hypothetical protein